MTEYLITALAQKPPSALVKEVSHITGDSLGEVYRRFAAGGVIYRSPAQPFSSGEQCGLLLGILASCTRHGCMADCTEGGHRIDEQFLRNVIEAEEQTVRHMRWLDEQGHA